MEPQKEISKISIQTFKRLPYYLKYLKELDKQGQRSVSAPFAAAHFGFTEIQVRKDFAAICTEHGKPKQGFDVKKLIYDIEDMLGYNNTDEAVLVGAGSLGSALLSYKGFDSYGLKIVAAFDCRRDKIDIEIGGKRVLSDEKLEELCRRMNIHIGIITVNEGNAQEVCDRLVSAGVLAIWNFAPVHLNVPDNILVQNENMAASLALLSKHLG